MKTLISEQWVIEAAKAGESIPVGPHAIVTAQARDTARRLGVDLVPRADAPEAVHGAARGSGACGRGATATPPAPKAPGEPALTAEEVERVCRLAMEGGLWGPEDIEAMARDLKVVS